MSARNRMLIVGGLAVALVIVAVVVSQSGSDHGPGGGETGDEIAATLEGIEQEGFSAGDPRAPLEMVEYGDLQCPFCADAAVEVVPELVSEYVESGDLRITFAPVAFIGEDSIEAAQMAAAAAMQDRGFAFVEQFYADQGVENTGYVTDEFLTEVGERVPGLDVDRALEDRSSAEAQALLDRASVQADRDRIESTPTFLLGERGGELEPIEAAADDPAPFRAAIERLLGE